MVARLFRLRLALAAGFFRGSFTRGFRAALVMLGSLAVAVLAAVGVTWMFDAGPARNAYDVAFGSLVLGLTVIIPLFDSRRNFSVRQFAQFPARPGTISAALLVSAIATLSFLVFVAWIVTLAVTRPEWWTVGWVTPVALTLIALFVLTGVRLASGISQLLAGDRYSGGLRLLGWVLIIALLPVLVFAVATGVQSEQNQALIDTASPLAWTPFGAGFAAITDVNAGDLSTGLARLGILGGTVVVTAVLWFIVARISIQRIDRPIDVSSARQGLGWFERFAAKPAQVIAAKQLTYWTRDPRYRIALLALPVAPIAVLFAFLVAGADLRLAAALPLPILMLLLGWSQHNDIAMDSTAIWEHVASGIRGRSDRAGRLVPVLLLGVPVAIIGSSLTVTFMGEWRVLPALIGMNLGVLCVATGVASVFSALMPYPATRPGDSPFVQPQWSGSGSGTSQTLSMLVALVLSVPPVVIAAMAIGQVSFVGNMVALVFGVLYGVVIVLAGVLIGGRIFDKQGPEILAVTQIFD